MKLNHFFLPLIIGFILPVVPINSLAQSSNKGIDYVKAGVLKERIDKVDHLVQGIVDQGDLPGIVVYIARNGETVLHKGYGVAHPESKKEMDRQAIFRIASQTKAITATAAMLLWEEGRFQLDDPVSLYLPAFKEAKVLVDFNPADSSYTTRAAHRPITIRQLLTHTSGLGYGVIDGDERIRKIYAKAGTTDLYTTDPKTIEEVVDLLATLPLHHDPGTKYTYGLGLDVIGRLIEVWSGQPLDVFFKERIFDPLGMSDTYFYLPKEKSERLVAIQHKQNNEWKSFPTTFYDPDYPIKGARSFFSGGAGLSSTASDYGKFLQMYLNGGTFNGKQILSPATIAIIMANQTGELYGGREQYYGLAFGVAREGAVANGGMFGEGTFSWGGYFNTQYFADPSRNLVVVIMKQTQGSVNDESTWKIKQLVTAALTNE
jgi:CubicO group peptidase (beta-lactamase class C family)